MKKRFLIVLFLFFSNIINPAFHSNKQKPFTVLLDPAGDAKHTGRVIDDSFERGITLQFTEGLKKSLEERNPNIRVILTRFPGETLEPLQNASFANRLDVDLYINLSFYQEKEERSSLYMYHFITKPTDIWQKNLDSLKFYSYDKAHLESVATSKLLGEHMVKTLEKRKYRTIFTCQKLVGLPFKPLSGIKAPAIGIEIGLIGKNDWEKYIKPIAKAIESALSVI